MEYVLIIFGTLMALNFGIGKSLSSGIYDNPSPVGEVEVESLEDIPTARTENTDSVF